MIQCTAATLDSIIRFMAKLTENYGYCRTKLLKLCTERIQEKAARTQHLLLLRLIIEHKPGTRSPSATPSRFKSVTLDETVFATFWQDFQGVVTGSLAKEDSKYSVDRAIKVRMYLLLSCTLSEAPTKRNLDVAIELLHLVMRNTGNLRLLANLGDILMMGQILSKAAAPDFFERLTSDDFIRQNLTLEFTKIIEKMARQSYEDLNRLTTDMSEMAANRQAKERISRSFWGFMINCESSDSKVKAIIGDLILLDILGEEDGAVRIRGVDHMNKFWQIVRQRTDETLEQSIGKLTSEEKTKILSNVANFWLFAFQKAKGPATVGSLSSESTFKVKIVGQLYSDLSITSLRSCPAAFQS